MNLGRLTEEYHKLKESCPGDILLYQVGTFYKIMYEDAKKVAGPLALKLFVTGEAANPVPVCGFQAVRHGRHDKQENPRILQDGQDSIPGQNSTSGIH